MLLGITIRGEILILKRKISFSLSASLSETPVAVTTDVAVALGVDSNGRRYGNSRDVA